MCPAGAEVFVLDFQDGPLKVNHGLRLIELKPQPRSRRHALKSYCCSGRPGIQCSAASEGRCGAQLGLRTANITNAPLCNSTARGNGSMSFRFDHEEPGREMHGSSAVGKASNLLASTGMWSRQTYACRQGRTRCLPGSRMARYVRHPVCLTARCNGMIAVRTAHLAAAQAECSIGVIP